MGPAEPSSFLAKVLAVAQDLYPDGIPAPPAWFPAEALGDLPPGAELLLRMMAADEGNRPVGALRQSRWEIVFLWIGLEAGDKARIDFNLDALLGTSGRGWLAKRMRSLGLDTADLHHELQLLCFDLIHDFARMHARVERGAAARGFFRQAFRNQMEDRISRLAREREAQAATEPLEERHDHAGGAAGLGGDGEIALRAAIERADLSDREAETLRLRLAGCAGQALADALGVEPKTAETLSRRARQKIEGAM